MGLLNLKCSACGATLFEDGGIYKCPHCGNTYTENNEQCVNNNFNNSTVIINNGGENIKSEKEYCVLIEKHLSIENYEQCYEIVQEALNDYPNNYKFWMAMVKITTKNYTKIFDTTHKQFLERALSVANAEEKAAIINEYAPFEARLKAEKEKEVSAEAKSKAFKWIIAVIVAVFCIIAFAIASKN